MAKLKAPKAVKVDLPKTAEIKETKVRTFQDVQQEFGALCSRAGQLQYQISAFKSDLELINKQIRDLNLEAAAIKSKEAEAAMKANEGKDNG